MQSTEDVDAPFEGEDWGALHLAAAEGDASAVSALLAHGARADAHVSSKVTPGHCPLHIAARYGHSEVLALLLSVERGDPDIQDTHGMSPLHYAAAHGHVACVEQLLSAGASPLTLSIEGASPLNLATALQQSSTEALLKLATQREAGRGPVKAWLQALGADKYVQGFLRAGYDDLAFLAKHGLTAEDLDCIGVPMSQLGLRRKLTALHNVAEFLPQAADESDGSGDEGGDSSSESSSGSGSGSGSNRSNSGSDADSDSEGSAHSG
jgi:Ankyrin repeats (3 copies)/SAM domain (Sterile alpha motif)/Ankyrin repeats (many copies)